MFKPRSCPKVAPRFTDYLFLKISELAGKAYLGNLALTLLRSDQRFASGGFVTVRPQRANC